MDIQVHINSEGALRNQRYAFTDRFTLVSELLQNSRRAGATLIELSHDESSRTLRVRDNGSGIDDFQKLLTFHESGWEDAVKQQEQPFGVGFSKCLYAASRCVVLSNGLQADIDTAAALELKPMPVRRQDDAAAHEPGTTIELHGVDLAGLDKRIDGMLRGFPVPVEFNGRRVPRPDAMDALEAGLFRETAVGAMRLPGAQDGCCSAQTRIYLQGFCVHRHPSYSNDALPANVVHLDSTRHRARLPDRDKLIDEDEQLKQVNAAIAGLWRQILLNQKGSLPPEQFVKIFYTTMSLWKHLDLLDDVPVLPRELCEVIAGYPVQESSWSCRFLEPATSWPTREDVECGRVKLVSLGIPSDESMAHWMFARATGLIRINTYVLSDRHWVHPHVRNLEGQEVALQAVGATHHTVFDGRWLWTKLVLCESVCIQIGGETVDLDEDGVFHNDTMFIPAREISGCTVQQASDFVDSSDHFREDDMDADTASLAELIHRLRAVDPVEALRSMLLQLNLDRFPLMHGRSFRLTIGAPHGVQELELLD